MKQENQENSDLLKLKNDLIKVFEKFVFYHQQFSYVMELIKAADFSENHIISLYLKAIQINLNATEAYLHIIILGEKLIECS